MQQLADETPLQFAERQVAQGAKRIARHQELIAETEAAGQTRMLAGVHDLLMELRRMQRVWEQHLAFERARICRIAPEAAARENSEDLQITPAKCRAARALLGWSRDRLAAECGVSVNAIIVYEQKGHRQIPHNSGKDSDPVVTIRAKFEQAGVEFTNGDEPGVKLRRTE